jgi:hypothetical protein
MWSGSDLLPKIDHFEPRLAARSAAYGVPSCYTKTPVPIQMPQGFTHRVHLPWGTRTRVRLCHERLALKRVHEVTGSGNDLG